MDELNKNDFSSETNDTVNQINDTANKPNEASGTLPVEPSAESQSKDTFSSAFSADMTGADHDSTVIAQPTAPSTSYAGQTAEITYAPSAQTKKAKKKKESRPARLTAVIAICLAAVILCGCAGFGGLLIANKLSAGSSIGSSSGDGPLVIYRDTTEGYVPVIAEEGETMTYAQVAAAVKDSVVEINTEYTTRSSWFQYVSGGAGSGVIISEDGYIVTNAHVVMNENSTALADSVTVRLSNGDEYDATVKGYDSDADIAVIKIDANGLTPAVCGNSDALTVGEELVVVGNPLGELGGTVTNGIVSATEREIEVSGKKMTLIQTNAAINPGNSGGGMFNMKGQLIGIVNAKSSGSDIEGLGFAIPVNRVLSVTEQLMEYGYVRGKVTIGVTFKTVSNSSLSYYYGIKPGIYVDALTEGLNDDVLKVGDRVIAVNGEEVSSGSEIASKVSECSVGDTLTLQLYRDNKLIEVTVTCYEKAPTDRNEIEFNEDGEADTNRGYDEYFGDDSGDGFSDPFDGLEDFFGGFFRG